MTSQVGGGTVACASSGHGRQSGGGLSGFIKEVHGDSFPAHHWVASGRGGRIFASVLSEITLW
jgi:hypothetical protein